MPTLTTMQINALQTKITNGDIAGFYTDIQSYGDAYGTLALSQTNNTGWQAQLSNGFAASAAEDDSVNLAYGSTAWTALNANLANRYLQAYRDNSNSTPPWDDVQDLHNDAYVFAGLDPNDWLPNKLLNDSANPGALWSDLLVNQGGSDLWDDTWAVANAGAELLFGPYLVYKALADASSVDQAQIDFAKNFANALAKLDAAALEEMLDDYSGNAPLVSAIQGLLDRTHAPDAPGNYFPGNDFPSMRELGDYIEGVVDSIGQAALAGTPLVLDIDASGTIELAALYGTGSVMWDIDNDGFAEASGWITGGDGLLCIDLNSDGIINDQTELFGGTNGYTALAAYDTNSSNTITSADTQFGSIRVWVDSNADGHSQSSELHTLNSLGITSITTTYSSVNYAIAGNDIKFQSTFVMNGNTYTSVDAFFNYDPANTRYHGDYTLDFRALFLPTVRGYGDLPDLHIAMSMDEDLLDLVQDFSELSVSQMMASLTNGYGGPIQEIMFRWAGVDGVSPTSRGTNIDARHLEFLEALTGQDWLGNGSPNPNPGAMPFLMEAWGSAYNAMAARLLLQTSGGQELFVGTASYDPSSDTFLGASSIDFATLEDWMDGADTVSEKIGIVKFMAIVIDEVIGIANLSTPDHDDLQALMPLDITVEAFASYVYGSGGTLNGNSSDNVLVGAPFYETLNGNGGNDILIAHDGYDVMYGGTGNDTYMFFTEDGANVSNPDQVNENTAEGTDTIVMAAGINPEDVRLWTAYNGYLTVKYGTDDLITIKGGVTGGTDYNASTVGSYLEQIVFDDGTVWNLTSGLYLHNNDTGRTLYGSAYGDTIEGGGGNDTLYGYGGNDTLTGHDGYDVQYGGTGNDTYVLNALDGSDIYNPDQVNENLSEGTDKIIFGAGIDPDNVFVWTSYNGYLNVQYGTNDIVTIKGGVDGGTDYDASTVGSYLEQILFDDSTVWDLTAGLHLKNNATGRTLYGSTSADTIEGGSGSDTLYGYAGTDDLIGGGSYDTLYGGGGNDILYGGADTDTLSGGSGADKFVFKAATALSASDTVSDFNTGQTDVLDIADIIDGYYNPLTDLISHYVRITDNGANSYLFVDQNGGANSFVQIATLSGVTNIAAGATATEGELQTLIANGMLIAA